MTIPMANLWHIPPPGQPAFPDRVKEDWIETAKHVLIYIQLRDNLEKKVVVRDYVGNERRILIKAEILIRP